MTFSAGQGLHELLVPVRCAGCGAPGVDWCEKCHKHLAGPPRRIHPRVAIPCPVWSISPYSGPVAAGIVALKEDRRQALAQPFGQALAHAAAQLVAAGEILHPAERPWLLVPAPSTALSIRERGFHHVREIAEAMAHTLQGHSMTSFLRVFSLFSLFSGNTRVGSVMGKLPRLTHCWEAYQGR